MATAFKISSESVKLRKLDVSSTSGSTSSTDSLGKALLDESDSSGSTSWAESDSSGDKIKLVSGCSLIENSREVSPVVKVERTEPKIDDEDDEESGDQADSSSGDVSVERNSRSPSPEVPDGQYEVEKVVDYNRDEGGDLYLVKWKNWEDEFNTWEPPQNLVNCDSVLYEFYKKRKEQYEQVLRESEFIVVGNGRKRRRGPALPQVPPDPRPTEVKIKEFFLRYGVLTEEEILKCHKNPSLSKKKCDNRTLNQKALRALHEALDEKLDDESITRLRTQLVEEEYIRRRTEHTDIMKKWESHINSISLGSPRISIENDVDWEGPPENFTYINDYLPTSGIVIPDDPPFGCSCISNCADGKSGCCWSNAGVKFAYTCAKRLRVPVGTPIYECNKKCKCDSSCSNRVVQDGRNNNMHFCIFRTANGRGWGVKTMRSIKKGTFVTLYVGEVINTEEAEKRGKSYDAEGTTYLFDLDFNEGDEEVCPYTVDAAHYGNVAHFINHSCDPNLGVFAVWVNCLDPNLPKLALFAIQDIAKGEEITFDYQNLIIDHEVKMTKECKCEAKQCRKYLF